MVKVRVEKHVRRCTGTTRTTRRKREENKNSRKRYKSVLKTCMNIHGTAGAGDRGGGYTENRIRGMQLGSCDIHEIREEGSNVELLGERIRFEKRIKNIGQAPEEVRGDKIGTLRCGNIFIFIFLIIFVNMEIEGKITGNAVENIIIYIVLLKSDSRSE